MVQYGPTPEDDARAPLGLRLIPEIISPMLTPPLFLFPSRDYYPDAGFDPTFFLFLSPSLVRA
jgi:hypothetical protein